MCVRQVVLDKWFRLTFLTNSLSGVSGASKRGSRESSRNPGFCLNLDVPFKRSKAPESASIFPDLFVENRPQKIKLACQRAGGPTRAVSMTTQDQIEQAPVDK